MNAPLPLSAVEDRGVSRFVTAGSVDDGKSTLIGRLLYDTRSILVDQLSAITRAGQRRALNGEADLSLLTDGLEAEREQGITIDVAYRFLQTAQRKFIVADAPGHEQYTRNMVTAASTADAAVILIDATRAGDGAVLPQTRRHTALVSLLGVRHVALAINKMDAMGFDASAFDRIVDAYTPLARGLGVSMFAAIPVSALRGDNVVHQSDAMPWYAGPSVLQWLLDVPDHAAESSGGALRMSVQGVRKASPRQGAGGRAYTGRIAAGTLSVGQQVRLLPSGIAARVMAIETFDGDLEQAGAGQSVAVRFDREFDVSRGDRLVDNTEPMPEISDHFTADLAWLDSESSTAAKMWVQCGTRRVLGRLQRIESRLDLDSACWHPVDASALNVNDIARVRIQTQQPLALDPYESVRAGGAFTLIDTVSHRTVAAGMVRSAQ